MSRASKEISVGAVISIAIVIFAVAVMAISKESRLFVPKARYWTVFENTSGLTVGSPVLLVGEQIGTVKKIDFQEDVRESRIRVNFTVAKTSAERIRVGTHAYLKSLNYLSQDKYLELVPGSPDQPPLPPGEFITPGRSIWEQTLERGQSIADDIKEITAAFRDLLVAVNQGGGIFQEMIHNPEFARQGVQDFQESLATLRSILSSIDQGRGLAGMLLVDDQFATRQMESIDVAVAHLRSAMERIDSDAGLIAQIEDREGHARQTLEDLRNAASSFQAIVKRFETGDGVVMRLMTDEAYADSLLSKIDSAAGHAESILGKIDRGEGTVGGIINDPEIHDGLKDIVAGIGKSRIGKGLVRHYGKKGAKVRQKAEDEAAPDGPETDPDRHGPTP